MFVKVRWLLRLVSKMAGFRVDAITIFPFIFTRVENKVLIRHEKIHWWQELETLIVPCFILYGLNYLYNLWVKGMDNYWAYKNIKFEIEAYKHQGDLNYKRKPYAWVKAKW